MHHRGVLLAYPQGYLRGAIGAFYFFIAFYAFCIAHPNDALDLSAKLAVWGIGSAATMWWVIDAMHRRNSISFTSLWLGYYWMYTLPAYVLTTRPRTHAIKRISKHAAFSALAALVGLIVGAFVWP